jgi:hypothetical protein
MRTDRRTSTHDVVNCPFSLFFRKRLKLVIENCESQLIINLSYDELTAQDLFTYSLHPKNFSNNVLVVKKPEVQTLCFSTRRRIFLLEIGFFSNKYYFYVTA